ncbi:hypothetical protein HK096_001089 [Nowakowskiella sp. JEL0078]|nr:hypothetical protein HK096_001089 [Nowakowskiella sp. JEL0078]
MLNLINKLRFDNDIPELKIDTRFTLVAQMQADYQALTCNLTHFGINNSSLQERVKLETGLSNIYLGENVAVGYPDVESVFDGWKNSPGHLANMISTDFNVVGFGFADFQNCSVDMQNFWSQDFGKIISTDTSTFTSTDNSTFTEFEPTSTADIDTTVSSETDEAN